MNSRIHVNFSVMISPLTRAAASLFLILALALWSSCSLLEPRGPLTRSHDSFENPITTSPPTPELTQAFTLATRARLDSVKKENGMTVRGYVTENRKFYEAVLRPLIDLHLEDLSKQHPVQVVNTLTLFCHEAYQTYFGANFYRWGGDIFDLDDPQEEGVRHGYAYGLDCSGFVSMPYEIAVLLGLLDPARDDAVFSSKGFARFVMTHSIPDLGGRDSTSNRCRLDTYDFLRLGREIFSIDSAGVPSQEEVSRLQAGDVVGTPGHVGIIVEIEGNPYYLESGGWVVRRSGGNPYRAFEALVLFARGGPVTVRRALPDYRTQATM